MTVSLLNRDVFVDGNIIAELPTLAANTIVRVWAVPNNYSESGFFISIQHPGEAEAVPACDLRACRLVGSVEYPADPATQANAIKAEKLAAIERGFQSRMSSRYPLERELYFARIAGGAALGTYEFQQGEHEELAEYQAFAESLRAWLREEKNKL